MHLSHLVVMLAFGAALCTFSAFAQQKKSGAKLIERVADPKELKKLLRVKTNVLILFANGPETSAAVKELMPIVGGAAEQSFGKATVAFVDCETDEGRKMCKKMKIAPKPILLKHYNNGEFHKDYDRQLTVESMSRFLADPTGEIPWEEDPAGAEVLHLDTGLALRRQLKKDPKPMLLKKDPKPMLVMFYAPWCGHCKRLKPDFGAIAREMKGKVVIAAMDVNRPENADVQQQYEIKGFPTLIYFEEGKYKFNFGGEPTRAGILKWLENPTAKSEEPAEAAAPEAKWSDEPSEVVHLTEATFADFIANNPSVLVMFYAPWCGHCKNMKPDYVDVAAKLKAKEGATGVLAAVDATEHRALGTLYNVQGFPTIKYFKDGQFAWDFKERAADKIYEFMLDPKEPPPPELPWSEQPGDVLHLTTETFKTELKKKKHALVMFYAPWCGHCKRAKPFYSEAATKLSDDVKSALAAVDCTVHQPVCDEYKVGGYPTFIYFSYLKTQSPYSGGHKTEDFVRFINERSGGAEQTATPAPPAPPAVDFTFDPAVKVATPENFDAVVSNAKLALVMFYAPWCGHCKSAKPAFGAAAAAVADGGAFVAMDCSVHRDLCKEKGVKGYPTFHIYEDGKFARNYGGGRSQEDFTKVFGAAGKTEL
uniref:Thioredoxin domain-containing protein n=1 Tax=Plectus sambesii TaxID=2011161 RepID=A0A914UM83_9BILA